MPSRYELCLSWSTVTTLLLTCLGNTLLPPSPPQSACGASPDTPHATWAVPTKSRGANTDNAFSKAYRSNSFPRADLLTFQTPVAEGKEFLLRQSSRWSEELAFAVMETHETTEGNYNSAFSYPFNKRSAGQK